MVPKITKILYATDLSTNSDYAFCYAVNLAEKQNTRITILHVLDNLIGTAQTLITSHLNEVQRDNIFKDDGSFAVQRNPRGLPLLLRFSSPQGIYDRLFLLA